MVDLLVVSQASLHNKQVMQRRKILDRVVSIVKMVGKRGTSYKEQAVRKRCLLYVMKKLITVHFQKLYFFLRSTIAFLSVIWKMLSKKCLQNKPDKHKHNRANRNTYKYISKITLLLLLYLS